MSDDTSKKDQRDRSKVAGSEPYELAYLEKKLNVSRSQIEDAISAVGNDRNKIEDFLKTHR